MLCYKQPDNVEAFLIEQIKERKQHGTRSIVYTDTELQNIFTLYDLKGSGTITKDQCREGKRANTNLTVLYSDEDFGQLRVPLHKGSRRSYPHKGGLVHLHEDLRRCPGN